MCGCKWSNKPGQGYKTEWSKTSIIITSATRCASGAGTCLHQRKGYPSFTAFHFLISRFMFNLVFLSVEPNTAVWSNELSMHGAFFHFFSEYLTRITARWALAHTHTHARTHTVHRVIKRAKKNHIILTAIVSPHPLVRQTQSHTRGLKQSCIQRI